MKQHEAVPVPHSVWPCIAALEAWLEQEASDLRQLLGVVTAYSVLAQTRVAVAGPAELELAAQLYKQHLCHTNTVPIKYRISDHSSVYIV